jgi:hypothetical protein
VATHIACHQFDGASVPDWVQLLPAGTFRGEDGRGPYILSNPAAVVAASMGEGKLPVDENHAIDLAAPKGAPSPARGWIVEMQARPDGIWGRVDWSETGRSLLQSKAYSFLSPVFMYSPSGIISRIFRAGLTNTPNLTQLKALNMSGSFDREIDGSKDVTPTAAERDIARRMNLDPNQLARMRVAREPQQRADDAARVKEFERLTTSYNDPSGGGPDARKVASFENATTAHGRIAAQATGPISKAAPTAAEREVARRMNVDPAKLAEARERREGKSSDDGLGKWDGYINPGGPGDKAYELTALDREACNKLGVDPQQFLAWKRDPINAPRPRGLPADPYNKFRGG